MRLRKTSSLVETINRRKVLHGAVSLGALSMLTGCDVTSTSRPERAQSDVAMERPRPSGDVQANHLAPTYAPSQVVKPPRFNAYYDVEDVAPVDAANWKLELAA